MTAREFWTRWHREIMRGTFLFAAVLAVGLLVVSGVHRARSGVRNLAFDLGADASSGPRSEAPAWTYITKLGSHQTLWIRNIRGPITLTSGDGDSALITAVRTFNKSDPESVRLVTGSNQDGVAVCAVWGGAGAEEPCTPGHNLSLKHGDIGPNDVAVRFEIRLPRGAKADLQTVTGDVKADATGPVTAGSVQGDVSVNSTSGEVDAHTVTGDVSVRLPGVLDPRGVRANTVTGDVSVELSHGVRATVSGHTVTGDVSNDFSLPVTGKFASHEVSGNIGNGGGTVRLETVTGDVSLQHLEETPAPPAPPTPPAARAHPRAAPRAGSVPPPRGKS